MNNIQMPNIETERFILKQLTKNDLPEWIRIKYSDPEMMSYMPKSDVAPEERAEKAFKFFEEIRAKHGYSAWVIRDKHTGQMVGDCYLEPEDFSATEEMEIGYDVGLEYWGKGVATEATRAILHFMFENTDVERILGVVMPDNIGSWRVLERLGFTFVGEDHLYGLDVRVYAIERSEFSGGDHFYRVYE